MTETQNLVDMNLHMRIIDPYLSSSRSLGAKNAGKRFVSGLRAF
jgi:hypothetical protein